MAWHAQLNIDYRLESNRTVARHIHSGPLRILQSLYPEGDAVCHNVLVHPPGGLVGGDTLDLSIHCQAGSHALITTPGATRFYRSEGPLAQQRTHIYMEPGSRLEWLPLEALCYSGCQAENRLTMQLAPGAELMGWDVTALGLPHAQQPFETGSYCQHLEVPGIWLERGVIDGSDQRLLNSAVGLSGMRCLASLYLTTGSVIERHRKQLVLDRARGLIASHALDGTAGVTSPNRHVIVVRVLAPLVEPAMQLLRQIRNSWREELWSMRPVSPRIWSM
jgi:urease accessory protein